MKQHSSRGLAVAIAAASLAALAAVQPAEARRPGPAPRPSPPAEVRALWVVRTSITTPADVKKVVEDARAAGVNTLIVQVRGRGDAYYKSRWEPRADTLREQPESFDPLAEMLTHAHAAGLRVHAWLNTHLLANLDTLPTDERHVFHAHPEWLAVPRRAAAELYGMAPSAPEYRQKIVEVSKGDRGELEGVYTAPSHPAVKEHVESLFVDVVENYDVDGVHFDYVRYPSPDFDYSRTALERFRSYVEPSLSAEERRLLGGLAQVRPLVYVELYPEAWDRFRREQITDLVERVRAAVKARKPHVEVTAAVFANDEDAYARRFQDWKLWLEKGLLDAVCPMAYTPETEVWKRQVAIARGFSFGKRVWAGIGAYRQPPELALEKVALGRRIGVDGFVFFAYGNMVRPSDHAPAGDYLLRIGREAFSTPPGR